MTWELQVLRLLWFYVICIFLLESWWWFYVIFLLPIVFYGSFCLYRLELTEMTQIKYFISSLWRFWLNKYALLHIKICLITENLYPWFHEYSDFKNLGQWIDNKLLAEIWRIWLKRFCYCWRQKQRGNFRQLLCFRSCSVSGYSFSN